MGPAASSEAGKRAGGAGEAAGAGRAAEGKKSRLEISVTLILTC